MNFRDGKRGESLWFNELSKTHTDIENAPNKRFYDWDIKGKYKGKETTYEVKYDSRGYYYADRHNRPVNLNIEFKNTNKDEDSGIRASKADYYIYILKSLDGVETAYVYDRLELLNHLEKANYRVRGNKQGGDDNAEGWTPPLDSLKHILRKKIVFKK